LTIRPQVRRELIGLLRKPTTPQRAVRRARVVLAAADGLANSEIARRVGIARQNVIGIRARFEERGLESVLQDAPGRGRPREISERTVTKIVEMTLGKPPKNRTQWSSRSMAELHGVDPSTVQRIWRAHHLQPHRVLTFKMSKDPQFVRKLRDIVGLYINPPSNAIVLSVDEKTAIQALERTAPILPLRPGIPARQTHDYQRNGTTNLFAALNTLSGKVIERCLPRHRHEEFIEFLEHIDRTVPARLDIYMILDNLATHKHADVRAWFAAHPRYHVYFTPTGSSWLNAVEGFFSRITTQRLRRGTFRSERELVRAITAYVADENAHAEPFIWTKSANKILKNLRKCHEIYAS
jgi:transposase